MKKNVFGRKFKRDHNERKALFKSLASELVLHESIKTTEAKAKAIKPLVEKLVTKARVGGLEAERALRAHLVEAAVRQLIDNVAPRFTTRNGGYTRIIKMPNRLNDNARVVMLEWVDKKVQDTRATAIVETPATDVVKAEVVSDTTSKNSKKKISSKKSTKTTSKQTPKKEKESK